MAIAMFVLGILTICLWIIAMWLNEHNETEPANTVAFIAAGLSCVVSVLVIINFVLVA